MAAKLATATFMSSFFFLLEASPNPTIEASPASPLPVNESANTITHHNGTEKLTLIAIIVGDALVLVLVSLLVYCCFRRKYAAKMRKGSKVAPKLQESEEEMMVKSWSELVPEFECPSLVDFDEAESSAPEMIGKQGYGNLGTAYKVVLDDGKVVAVKRLKDALVGDKREFEQHMTVLGRLSHPNLT